MKSNLITAAGAMEPVAAVTPVAAYIGGKKNLAKRICAIIDTIPHGAYAEAFVGMGGIFFRRRNRPKAEFINDWSAEVHNFFRILQVHYVPFLEMMRFQITSRAEFDRLTATDPATLTDMQRAARFLYLQRTSFGGKVTGQCYGADYMRGGRFDITRLQPMLEAVHDRLSAVGIERLPWADFIRKYDRPEMLFYLDPPYHGNEDDYGKGLFGRDEFEAMANQLAGIKGKFLLSINDNAETRRIFARFDQAQADVTYSIGKAGSFGELIISNAS